MTLDKILPLLVPIIAIQLILLLLAIRDLLQSDRRVRGGNKGLWALIIVFVNIIGPIVYFMAGREDA